jgi:hypothetical protein
MTIAIYKARAESRDDVITMINSLPYNTNCVIIPNHIDFPAVEVQFESPQTIIALRKVIKDIQNIEEDIILETLNYLPQYTGERYYNI